MAKVFVHRKGAHAGEVGFNMTPMIDCTFQLIIFFILASQIANKAYAKNITVPRPDESQSIPIKDYNVPNKLTINVVSADPRGEAEDPLEAANAGWYEIDGKRYEVGDIVPIIELVRNEKVLAEAAGAIGGSTGREFIIEVRADKRVNWHDVAPVIRAGVEAGVRKMNITALTQQD
jgi:biopolymer transport protein ExbD